MNNNLYRAVKEINPVTKLILVLSFGIGSMIYPSPGLAYCILMMSLTLAWFIGLGKKTSFLVLGFGVPVTLMLLFIQGLYSPKNVTVIADLGFAQVGLEGSLYALKISSTLLVFLATFYLFMQTTRNSETVAALTQSGLNMKIGYLVLASLNVVPQMQRKVKIIQEAQESRGVEVTGNFIQRAKAFLPLIGPVVLSSLTDAQERGMTLETRGFSIKGVKPISFVEVKKGKSDTVLKGFAVLFLLFTMAIRFWR
ncbi:energy-coupling factor transporter transmembrane component T [Enterococcus malodoratus]|uniref:energy-coupling factor transporter transmembrane component T n=1 Tax=Enterococcus malodoratus TaxID=71451 RepID=UPI0022E45F70|nr:energy-coupling factor transporter transmembrane component T [Enterococcus malodoratus]